jgi:hypothetical protein
MAFNQSSIFMPSCSLAKSAASPERIFRLVAAPADDHGINIADVAIGEIELTLFRVSRSTRFVALGLTGVRFRSGRGANQEWLRRLLVYCAGVCAINEAIGRRYRQITDKEESHDFFRCLSECYEWPHRLGYTSNSSALQFNCASPQRFERGS